MKPKKIKKTTPQVCSGRGDNHLLSLASIRVDGKHDSLSGSDDNALAPLHVSNTFMAWVDGDTSTSALVVSTGISTTSAITNVHSVSPPEHKYSDDFMNRGNLSPSA